jgi:hypothetical protein
MRDKVGRNIADAAAENGVCIAQEPASHVFIVKGVN